MPTPPGLDSAFAVFAQRADARVDIVTWNAHAERFFATRIGLTADKHYGGGEDAAPRVDSAGFVVAPDGAPAGIRQAFARPCEPADYALAERLEARAGGAGLARLARRCQTLWLIAREASPDPLALRLAAILASVLLGPIVDAAYEEIFGVKTARSKLERPSMP